MATESGRRLVELAARFGFRGDLGDGHCRWQLYGQALEAGGDLSLLREAVGKEDDAELALSIAFRALAEVPSARHDEWVAVAPEPVRARAQRRSDETVLLRLAESGELESGRVDSEAWTDWLQRQMAAHSIDQAALRELAAKGRTRKVRRLAERRCREGDEGEVRDGRRG